MDMAPALPYMSIWCVDLKISGPVLATASDGSDYGAVCDGTNLFLYLLATGALLHGDGGMGDPAGKDFICSASACRPCV